MNDVVPYIVEYLEENDTEKKYLYEKIVYLKRRLERTIMHFHNKQSEDWLDYCVNCNEIIHIRTQEENPLDDDDQEFFAICDKCNKIVCTSCFDDNYIDELSIVICNKCK